MESAGALGDVDAGDGSFAEPDTGFVGRAGDAEAGSAADSEERAKKDGKIGVVPNDQDVVIAVETADHLVEGGDAGVGAECFRDEDSGVIAGFGADERSGLERALERAGDDEIKLYIQGIEVAADEQTLLLALLVEWAPDVNEGICAARSGAGVAKDVEIHGIRPDRNVTFNTIVTIGR